MTPNFDINLAKVGSTIVKLNISGFDGDVLNGSSTKLSIYAYDSSRGTPLFSTNLGIEELRRLYTYLSSFSVIKENLERSETFREIDGELKDLVEKIEKVDPTILTILLKKMSEDQRIASLLSSLTDEEFNELDASKKQASYKNELAQLDKLIKLEISSPTEFVKNVEADESLLPYKAGQPEKIFQNWVEKNLWALGGEYYKKHDARKIGINAESDLIVENAEGFIDLIELKRPSATVFKYDESHKSYYPSPELALVIGQSLNYLKILDTYKPILEQEYKVKVIKPRVIIVIGDASNFNEEQLDSLRMLNSNLNHIKVVTYSYFLSTGQKVIDFYQEKD